MDSINSRLGAVSRVGLGAWAIGGPYEFGWGPVDDVQSIETIHSASDSGINWIDTAPAYGCGHSEEVVGRALTTASHPPMVFTKCGRVWDSSGKVTSDLRPHSIRAQWKQSAARLGLETIALYQIHRPDTVTGTSLGRSWEELATMRAEGRVKAIGLCNVTLAQYHECSSIARVDALQVAVNVLRPGDAALRRAAYDEGTLVLAFSPMESGLLTGTFDHARVQALPSDDWRKRSPKFGPEALVSAAHIVSALTKVSRRTGYPVPALAVAWSLRQNGVSASIVGARDPRQIAEWREAPSINLEPQDWAEVDSLARTERG